VALVGARENDHVWGKRYRGKLAGILDLQDQIARDVAANLRLGLTDEEDRRLTKRYTEDPEAYLLYREGTYHWNKFTEDGLSTAIEYYGRALKKDPNYALAYVGLAQVHVLLGNLYRGPLQTFADARKCAEKAIELDESILAAHTYLGAVYLFHDWNWAAAEIELKQGIGSTFHMASLTLYGFYQAALGRLPEAFETLRRGQELEPLAAAHRNELAMAFNWLRQHDQAIVEGQKAIDLDPNFPLAHAELGIAYVQQGRTKEAIALLGRAVDLGQKHPSVLGILGYAYGAAGKRPEALKVVEELTAVAPGRFGFALPIARTFAALKEADQAFEWLRKACKERSPFVIWLKVDPTLDNLRSDSRFNQIVKDMGLPPRVELQP
jgi:tetratricopeptide (TPR) repeat protein